MAQFDLEERTFVFARRVRAFVKTIPRTVGNIEDARQLIRASGSAASNYIEANEGLSKKDFRMRIKICRKESKESRLFLRLIDCGERSGVEAERDALIAEALEFVLIFTAILKKTE